MTFKFANPKDENEVKQMSGLASRIYKEYYDELLGAAQNDYMIDLFLTPQAIADNMSHGYSYCFARADNIDAGFMAFYPRGDAMYLSKLYLDKPYRGKGYAHAMIDFVKSEAVSAGLHAIELNVNKNNVSKYIYERLGFRLVRDEKNDIGHGYYMDDYVYRLDW